MNAQKYTKVPTEPTDGRPDEIWKYFKPKQLVAFCFRKADSRALRYTLNNIASIASRYIHVELCLLNSLATGPRTQSIYITSNSQKTCFDHKPYTDDPSKNTETTSKWKFVWVALTPLQLNTLKESLQQALREGRVFSSANIYCFYPKMWGCGRDPRTITCSQLCVEIIDKIWPGVVHYDSGSYTPLDVYNLLLDSSKIQKYNIKQPEDTGPTPLMFTPVYVNKINFSFYCD